MTANRHITPLGIFTIGFGATVGIGWVMLTGLWINQAGPVGAAVAFLVGGLAIAIIGLNYAEAARRFPFAGGEMTYCHRFFGRRTAWFAGYLLLLLFLSVVSFEGIAVPWLLSQLYAAGQPVALYQALGRDVYALDVAMGLFGTLALILITRRGADFSGKVQNILIGIFLLASIVFIGAGLISLERVNLFPLFTGATKEAALQGMLLVLVTTPFFYAGFNCIPQTIAETDQQTVRLLPKLITYSVLASGVFYIGVIFATAGVMQREELLTYELPVIRAFEVAFNSRFAAVTVMFAGLLGLVTSWNAMFFASTRLVAAMAAAGFLPPFLGRRNTFGAPLPAILLTGAVSSIAMLLGRGFVEPIISTAGTIVSILFMLVCFGVLFHKPMGQADRKKLRNDRLLGLSGSLLASSIFLIALVTHYRKTPYTVPAEWLIIAAWLSLAILLSFITGNPKALENNECLTLR